ncbi:uncharacterized protein LOC143917689 [Arctopsyche grandis]|uniref:uncharacterized protein LOC143917689 n=1 Tax=Arctopsyche grandis TaxID=121162 RepID=UPI00406D64BF
MDVIINDANDPIDWENEEQKKDIIFNICKIDSEDTALNMKQLRDLFTIARNALRFMVESKKNVSTKSSASDEDDSSASSNYLYEIQKSNELKTSISEKKLYIKEILADLQVTDEENKVLRERLDNIKEKLSEATLHIQDLDAIIKNIKSENTQNNEQIENLKSIQSSSQLQIKNLIETNKGHENQMEDFIQQMDFKLNEWKGILDNKESKINSLNQEIYELRNKVVGLERQEPAFVEQMVKERDIQIDELQVKLSEATDTIISSTNKIEKLKSEILYLESVTDNLSSRVTKEPCDETDLVESMRNDLQKYKNKSEELENCLKTREFEVADTLKKINSFENETFGMKEFIQKNKKVLKQLNVRDKQISNLITENNGYKQLIEQLQFENSIMRKKLNIPTEELFDDSNILYKYGKIRKQLDDTQKKLSSSDEEKILLQIRLRQKEKNIKKLYEYLSSIGIKISDNFLSVAITEHQAFEENNNIQIATKFEEEPCLNLDNTSNNVSLTENEENFNEDYILIKEKHQQLVDENEGLRKCLNEILHAVKDKVTDSTCEINLQSVESLLNILDSRHVAGWYHPAMRMLMELNQEKGCQDNLRCMLKDARMEVTSTLELLNQERQKNLSLENKFTESENKSKFETVEISKDNENEDEFEINEFDSIRRENTKFQILSENMIEIFTQSTEDKSKWQSMEEQYKSEIENLTSLLNSMKIRLDGVEKLKKFPENFTKYNDKKSISLDINNDNVQIVTEVKNDLTSNISDVLNSIENIDSDKKLLYEVAHLRNQLRKSIPLTTFIQQNEKCNNLMLKYRKMLNNFQKLELELAKTNQYESESEGKLNEDEIVKTSKQITFLENKNIDKMQSLWLSDTNQIEINDANEIIKNNEILKIDNIKHKSKISELEEHVNTLQQCRLIHDLELNMLRHQILDLQSSNDDKAIIARPDSNSKMSLIKDESL